MRTVFFPDSQEKLDHVFGKSSALAAFATEYDHLLEMRAQHLAEFPEDDSELFMDPLPEISAAMKFEVAEVAIGLRSVLDMAMTEVVTVFTDRDEDGYFPTLDPKFPGKSVDKACANLPLPFENVVRMFQPREEPSRIAEGGLLHRELLWARDIANTNKHRRTTAIGVRNNAYSYISEDHNWGRRRGLRGQGNRTVGRPGLVVEDVKGAGRQGDTKSARRWIPLTSFLVNTPPVVQAVLHALDQAYGKVHAEPHGFEARMLIDLYEIGAKHT